MRKTFVLAALMLSLLTLTASMPVVKATAYTWDGLCFGEGQMSSGLYIKYPHPRRDIYGISPYSGWTKQGTKLYHTQMDHDTSEITKYGVVAVCTVIGAIIGHAYGAVIGAIVGIVLVTVVGITSVVLQDELGCVWWWISISFMNWVEANAWWLGPLASLAPTACEGAIMSAFLLYGYLRLGPVTFHDAVGAGNPAPPSGGGGGCPFVYTWNGTGYSMDNNLIPASETSGGADVEDYYMLQQPLVGDKGSYSLLIKEFEQEHSYLDQVKLFAADHLSNVNVAVSPDREFLTYKDPTPPETAVTNDGLDVLEFLTAMECHNYTAYAGDTITLDFGNLDVGRGAKLVLRTDCTWGCKLSIVIQVVNSLGSWTNVTTIIPRCLWGIDIVDLSDYLPDTNGDLKVRLYFTQPHRIDYVGLDTSQQASIITWHAIPISAIHSTEGNVTRKLLFSDGTYTELLPGEQIELRFWLPRCFMGARTFIIYTKGHYYTITE